MTKYCKFCKKEVDAAAIKCSNCGSWLVLSRSIAASYYSKLLITSTALFLAFWSVNEIDESSNDDTGTSIKVTQMDSIKVAGIGFRVDDNDCYDKKVVGHVTFTNAFSSNILNSITVQIMLLKGDSIKYSFLEHIYEEMPPKSSITKTVDEKLSLSESISFDSVKITVQNGRLK